MSKDLLYIISDSGSSFTATGFCKSEDAERWLSTSEYKDDSPATVVSYDTVKHEFGAMELVNIVRGWDLYDFWRFNDVEMLMSSMEMHEMAEASASEASNKRSGRLAELHVQLKGLASSLNLRATDEVDESITDQDILDVMKTILAQTRDIG